LNLNRNTWISHIWLSFYDRILIGLSQKKINVYNDSEKLGLLRKHFAFIGCSVFKFRGMGNEKHDFYHKRRRFASQVSGISNFNML
jgi:hypothetical protein